MVEELERVWKETTDHVRLNVRIRKGEVSDLRNLRKELIRDTSWPGGWLPLIAATDRASLQAAQLAQMIKLQANLLEDSLKPLMPGITQISTHSKSRVLLAYEMLSQGKSLSEIGAAMASLKLLVSTTRLGPASDVVEAINNLQKNVKKAASLEGDYQGLADELEKQLARIDSRIAVLEAELASSDFATEEFQATKAAIRMYCDEGENQRVDTSTLDECFESLSVSAEERALVGESPELMAMCDEYGSESREGPLDLGEDAVAKGVQRIGKDDQARARIRERQRKDADAKLLREMGRAAAEARQALGEIRPVQDRPQETERAGSNPSVAPDRCGLHNIGDSDEKTARIDACRRSYDANSQGNQSRTTPIPQDPPSREPVFDDSAPVRFND